MNLEQPHQPLDLPLRVLHVITKGELGGAQTHVGTLCQALHASGQILPIVAIGGNQPDTPLAQALQAQGILVLQVPFLDNRLGLCSLWRAVQVLRSYLHKYRIDLLHAHSAAAGVVVRIAGHLARVPVVYTVHGFAFKLGAPWPRRMMAWIVEFALAPLTQFIICVSEYERHLARRLPIDSRKISVIRNGIEDIAIPSESMHAAKHAIPTMAMVARMAPPKRPDLVLLAIAQLRNAIGYEVPITFFGGGPGLSAQRALAKRLGLQVVRFAGDVDDVPIQLVQHAIFVLMSDHEGLPISLIEAMRAGMAIVASDLPGIRELLPNVEHAILVPQDANALATALRLLIESPALRTQMGIAARKLYEQHYTAHRMSLEVRLAYAAVILHSH